MRWINASNVRRNRSLAHLRNAMVLFLTLAFATELSPLREFLGSIPPVTIGRISAHSMHPGRRVLFEENRGQVDSQVLFLAHGQDRVLYLTAHEAVLALNLRSSSTESLLSKIYQSTSVALGPQKTAYAAIGLKLLGADQKARASGIERISSNSNYLISSDSRRWRIGVPAYAAVEFRNIYSGIDLLYHGNQNGDLEYDFRLAPNANPSLIRFSIDGGKTLRLRTNGDLQIESAAGNIIERAPRIYQEIGAARQTVSGAYLLRGNTVSFQLGKYDRRRPLIIDPSIVYSTYFGGSGRDYGQAIAADAAGNTYITGQTASPTFPVTVGSAQPAHQVAFVTKFDPNGNVVYSTLLGGSIPANFPYGIDGGTGMAVDPSGNAYVTGFTSSFDFPVTSGAYQTSLLGQGAAFVTKLNATGTGLIYSTFLGGTIGFAGNGGAGANAIAIDPAANAYVTGETNQADFPVTANAPQQTNRGGFDGFVAKFDPSGSALLYSTFLGGSGFDGPVSVAVDQVGNAYVAGNTTSTDFPTTSSAFQTSFPAGDQVAFVTKLDASGSNIAYSTFLVAPANGDYVAGIALDTSGDAFVVGNTYSGDFPTTPGAFQTTFLGGFFYGDAFVTKLSSDGSRLLYSTLLGGATGGERGNAVAVDGSGNAYVAGFTTSSDFPIVGVGLQRVFTGSFGTPDGFLTAINPTGSALLYSGYLGGSNGQQVYGVALDPSRNVYLTGLTASSDFPITPGAAQSTFGGDVDAFVAKIEGCPPTSPPFTFTFITGKLSISNNQFQLDAAFNLQCGSDGIFPLKEKTTLQVASFAATLPAGSFTQDSQGAFVFQGPVNGATLQMRITLVGGSYRLQVQASGSNVGSKSKPVPIALTIGDDTGTTSIVPG